MKLRRVDDVMTRDVVTVDENCPYDELVRLLIRKRVSGLLVVNRFGHVLGVVSETDLLHRLQAPHRLSLSRRGRRRRAKATARTARDLMTAPATPVRRSLSVEATAERMLAAGVRRLPVEDESGRLVGIITRSDLLRAAVDESLPPSR
ncbi:hypothetical protein GCM10010435_42020 [Winogradskya consettensis]|uniref:CBS domain-containing protein n=1 Tax=Winogradskya consettensis TaxID=113560 RepID=A0A919SPR3_9ACTN|nr:CBS domain-containing protein [Actinoplanes consettensis]GIM76740.1 hypothetical protein Aco04nite_51860 [Actinoplanes consettensis]